MKSEEKNGGLMRGRFHIKTTQIPPFFCCIPVFQSFLSLHIPLSFANFFTLAKKISRSADHRCIFIFISVFFSFRVHQSLSVFWFWPFHRKFPEKSSIKTMKRCQRQNCVRKLSASRLHLKNLIHTVRKRQFEKQDWTEAGATKWRAFF